jgi:hypothetical protein
MFFEGNWNKINKKCIKIKKIFLYAILCNYDRNVRAGANIKN